MSSFLNVGVEVPQPLEILETWQKGRNLIDTLRLRESQSSNGSHHKHLQRLVEGCSVSSNAWSLLDCVNSPETVSTISVAISHDGMYIATSHGDHTVKILKAETRQIVKVFRGHPRTPWTVKFHPNDSNLLASGCLGGELRVWSISQGMCINVTTVENSVISLAFHPSGDHIALSFGYFIQVWDWKQGMAQKFGGYPPGEDPLHKFNAVQHPRNIRAVLFHPSGDVLYAAAPDHPRSAESSSSYTTLRLYAIPFSALVVKPKVSMPASGVVDTTSDGWRDESLRDSNEGNEQRDSDEMQDEFEGEEVIFPLWSMPTVIPEVHLYSDGGLDVSKDGLHLLSCALLYTSDIPRTQQWNRDGYETANSSSSNRNRTNVESVLENPQTPGTPTTGLQSILSQWFPAFARPADLADDGIQVQASSSSADCRTIDLIEMSTSLDSSLQHEIDEELPQMIDTRNGEAVPPGWSKKEFLCVFTLDSLDVESVRPRLIHYRRLEGSLMKAVTSTKLSPSGQFALVGYGVRTDGIVVGHSCSDVTCEVVSWSPGSVYMGVAGLLLNTEDEVNIAQWQTASGTGIVYGTKRGVVRACKAATDLS